MVGAVVAACLLATGLMASAANAEGINVNQPVTTKTTYTISGTIKRQSDHAPVADAAVYASSARGLQSSPTDAAGNFKIYHLLPGTYTIHVTPPFDSTLVGGFWTGSLPNHYSQTGPGDPVTITHSNVTGKGVSLPDGFEIKGKVTETNGTSPLGYYQVHAQRQDQTAEDATNTFTDSSGRFTFAGLGPGSYTIWFGVDDVYQSGCYVASATPNRFSPNCASSTAVVISNANRTGVNVRLPHAVQLSGTVKDRNGNPIEGASVATIATSTNARDFDSGYTDANGQFTFPGVTPGSYLIWIRFANAAFPDGYYRASDAQNHWIPDESAATHVNVNDDARLPLIRPGGGFTISGKVTDAAGAPLPYARLIATDVVTKADKRAAYTDASGHYDLVELAPGKYVISVQPPSDRPTLQAGFYATSGSSHFTALRQSASAVTVAGNAAGKNMRIPVGASISGTLTKDHTPYDSSGYTTIRVVGTTNGIVREAATNSSGHYQFTGLPAGTYKIYVFGLTTYPTATSASVSPSGYYQSAGPNHFTTKASQATVLTVSP